MTERFEIATLLQRELVNDRAVFGESLQGSAGEPGVYMESVHHLMKVVSGVPNVRPPWFFDTAEQGEGLSDIGTHLVDLVQWTLLPNQPIDYRRDIAVLAAQRWPTVIPEADFRRVTGAPEFPEALAAAVKEGGLEYFCNTLVTYRLRGIHVTLNVIWDWEAPEGGGDTHFARYRGSLATVDVRQTRADGFRPELYVLPAAGSDAASVRAALERKVADLQQTYPGHQRGRARRPSARRHPGQVPRGARGPLRAGDLGLPRLPAQSRPPAGVGTSEHAREVLRDDDGH